MGKFEVYTDKGGKYRFRLKAGNGQTILASQGYASKSGCENGIDSVRKELYRMMLVLKDLEVYKMEIRISI